MEEKLQYETRLCLVPSNNQKVISPSGEGDCDYLIQKLILKLLRTVMNQSIALPECRPLSTGRSKSRVFKLGVLLLPTYQRPLRISLSLQVLLTCSVSIPPSLVTVLSYSSPSPSNRACGRDKFLLSLELDDLKGGEILHWASSYI